MGKIKEFEINNDYTWYEIDEKEEKKIIQDIFTLSNIEYCTIDCGQCIIV